MKMLAKYMLLYSTQFTIRLPTSGPSELLQKDLALELKSFI